MQVNTFDAGINTNGALFPTKSVTEPITLGTFFDPEEIRFGINASSYAGREFLDPMTTTNRNPFKRIYPGPSSTLDQFLQSEEYKYWCWHWWDLNGKMNGIRGNWNKENNSWDYPQVNVKFSRNLKDYQVKGADNLLDREYEKPDGTMQKHKFGVSRLMEDRFNEDLEQCNVAVICAHGGAIEDKVQFKKCIDVWFRLGRDDKKLGSGKLRHLFFHSCSTMTCFKELRGQVLTREWMPGLYVDGLNTACGTDGDHSAWNRNGWRFFSRYHKGDSISDSWAFATIDECLPNSPATVAYGETIIAASKSLFEGRFSTKSVPPKYSVGSLWNNIKIPK